MSRPLAIDLFCGAGGASMGLHRAGFDVIGVDIKPQPRYPFQFVRGDALDQELLLEHADFVWASPPCQAHTALKTMPSAKVHDNLIPQTKLLLRRLHIPYAIENVIGASLRANLMLCGTMFSLGIAGAELRRHRIFETSFHVFALTCNHGAPIDGSSPDKPNATIGIYGEGCRNSRRKYDRTVPEFTIADGRAAMGIDWMTTAELSQAIPPAYSEYIGRFALPWVQLEESQAA